MTFSDDKFDANSITVRNALRIKMTDKVMDNLNQSIFEKFIKRQIYRLY